MEFTSLILIGAIVVLSINLSTVTSELEKLNRKADKIMKALSINENEYNLTDDELMNIILTKGKIKAIKKYREITGVGLKEAKEYVDNLNENKVNE